MKVADVEAVFSEARRHPGARNRPATNNKRPNALAPRMRRSFPLTVAEAFPSPTRDARVLVAENG
jgi:hypothetical protein